ncbi:expansin-A1-like [Dioscorea cayenensis subsp. rotundata]|uniref:Expansin n=1 Tax=Dioscorea cayennensis subsp. rotundata TaxID=55577 RepID=A0AB40CMM4_DIOCR|nr:expansin-A1-like [Dioscorea cayenensis subsp. rotundata]
MVEAQGEWSEAHATGYSDDAGTGTGGACGYDDVFKHGYGLTTAALSTALFNNGYSCGSCFQLRCFNDPQWCSTKTITVTATNFCPPSSDPNAKDGWCNPPLKHFDLSLPMFRSLVNNIAAGIIPVQYKRVPCSRQGGIKFEINGNDNFLLVLVYNVGGVGDLKAVSVKGSKSGWTTMGKNWGANWSANANLRGQSLSFSVTTSDGKTVLSQDVAPQNWEFGMSYEGKQIT